MNLFYAKPQDIQENSIVIYDQEAKHITKVLRHSVGDQILVTDGRGRQHTCNILDVKKRSVYLDILHTLEQPEPKPKIILFMGIIKKRDRLEFAVEKAVELGIAKIVLFEGEHSQKGNVREDRLESTAISAMKQSLRFYLPKIVIEKNISDAISKHAQTAKIILADETTTGQDKINFIAGEYCLVVGPEGGFSSNERKILRTFDPDYYSLGEHRLRAETAAIVIVDRFVNRK